MNNIFENLCVDKDTKILSREQIKVKNYDVMLEKWSWDGLIGHSAIIPEQQIKAMGDDKIQEYFIQELAIEGKVTISRGKSGFVYLNYGFKAI